MPPPFFFSRIRTETQGGAWCPRNMISKDAYEWLEIDLGKLTVITLLETQGRFGNGQVKEIKSNGFLGAIKHLYKRVCLSVRPSVGRSVTPSHFRRFWRASEHRVASIGSYFRQY